MVSRSRAAGPALIARMKPTTLRQANTVVVYCYNCWCPGDTLQSDCQYSFLYRWIIYMCILCVLLSCVQISAHDSPNARESTLYLHKRCQATTLCSLYDCVQFQQVNRARDFPSHDPNPHQCLLTRQPTMGSQSVWTDNLLPHLHSVQSASHPNICTATISDESGTTMLATKSIAPTKSSPPGRAASSPRSDNVWGGYV